MEFSLVSFLVLFANIFFSFQAKKDRLVEEVRRHFGFKIDSRDDRFKELLEQKEKEERKKVKEAKKKVKQQQARARLEEQVQLAQEADSVAQKP
jgi:RNase H-fold protein (predicted Holliday junction resolvase)